MRMGKICPLECVKPFHAPRNIEQQGEVRKTITGGENPCMAVPARVQVPVLPHLNTLYTWRRPCSVWPAARPSQAPIVNPWECLRLYGFLGTPTLAFFPRTFVLFHYSWLSHCGDGGGGVPFRLLW